MEFIQIGKVANTHGIRGDIKILPTTDDVSRFELLERVYMDTGRERQEVTIVSLKYFKHMVILNIKEFQSMDDALPYKGASVLIPMEEALPLEENENYIFELIGLEAREEDGTVLGPITDVLQNGRHDVYVIDDNSKNGLMIPATLAFVPEVNVEEGYVIVRLIDGLRGL